MIKNEIGDYGRFVFLLRKKQIVTEFSLVATVVDTDAKYILLKDNDDIEYIPKRADILLFDRLPADILLKTTA